MKSIKLFLLLCLVISTRVAGQDTLLLFHPTAHLLEVIKYLSDNNILKLDGYHLLGVFHEQERYDYQRSLDFLKDNDAQNITIQEIKGSLEPEVLYGRNECTDQIRDLFSRSRGALFMGGPDIPPVTYGEDFHLLTEVTDPFRHYWELTYLFHILGGSQEPEWIPFMERNREYLVSGICLGMQTLNVATGGTLIQDIPTEIYGTWKAEEVIAMPPEDVHRNYLAKLHTDCEAFTSFHFHPIKRVARTPWTRATGLRRGSGPQVLSSHHQAVETPGLGFRITATSMDGKIAEAMEHVRYPFVLGVQFHPEPQGLYDPDIINYSDCSTPFVFSDVIRDTGSEAFHLAYWDYIGTILQKNRKEE